MSIPYYDHIANEVRALHQQCPAADDYALAEKFVQRHVMCAYNQALAWVKAYRPQPQQPQQQPTKKHRR